MLFDSSEGSFLKKNIIYIIIAAILCIVGRKNNIVLIGGLSIIAVGIMLSSMEHRFCWSFFLIPNIRLFDNLEVTILVNVLMVVPLFFYLGTKIIKKEGKIMGFPIFAAFFLYSMEKLHLMSSSMSDAPLISWVFAFLLCCYMTLDNETNIKKNDVLYGLAVGIIFSAAVYLISNASYTENLLENVFDGARFAAYGDDPNYYSLYICLSLSSIVIKDKIRKLDYIIMCLLICIGFLTASKMCLVLMIVNIVYLILTTNDNVNKFTRNAVIFVAICIISFIYKEYIAMFFDNLFNRAGGNKMTLDSLTTGRYSIIVEYVKLLLEDFKTLMFGKGFQYHMFINTVSGKGAHNTYLDFILAWGFVGTLLFFSIMKLWVDKCNKKRCVYKYSRVSKFPLLILLINCLDLSCFSANMFFFIVTFCLIQLDTGTTEKSSDNGKKEENSLKMIKERNVTTTVWKI